MLILLLLSIPNPSNENHITYEPRNGDWLTAELNANSYPSYGCEMFCTTSTVAISATNDSFCGNSTITLSVPAISGVFMNWTVSSNLQIISGQGTASILIGPTSNATGVGYVTLPINSNCGNFTLYKDISVTPSIINFRWTGTNPSNPASGEPLSAEVDPVPGANYYEWYSDNRLITTTSDPNFYTYDWDCNEHNLKVRAITTCGNSDFWTEMYWGLCTHRSSYVAYPNPANNELTISYTEASNNKNQPNSDQSLDNQSSKEKSFVVKLYNDKGNVLRTSKNGFSTKSIILNTQDISNGTYFLHIEDKNEVIKKQIVIHH